MKDGKGREKKGENEREAIREREWETGAALKKEFKTDKLI